MRVPAVSKAISLDAVNGSQLFAAIDEIETNAKVINNNKTAIIKTQNNLKDLAVGVQILAILYRTTQQTFLTIQRLLLI